MRSIERQNQLFPLLLVNFIRTLGFSIILSPFIVFLVRDFEVDAIAYGILGETSHGSVQLRLCEARYSPLLGD